jgi:hypothetical protein
LNFAGYAADGGGFHGCSAAGMMWFFASLNGTVWTQPVHKRNNAKVEARAMRMKRIGFIGDPVVLACLHAVSRPGLCAMHIRSVVPPSQ